MPFLQRPRLPVEVISMIVKEVATSDDDSSCILYQISLVSRALWDMAQRHLFIDLFLNSNPRTRMAAFHLLSGPRGKRRGRHLRCLYLFESDSWLQSPEGAELLDRIVATAPNIRVLHIGYNFGYLDWAGLSCPLKNAIVKIMFNAKKIILEGLKNFPLQYFRVFRSIQTLDLSHVALAPLPAPNALLNIPTPPGAGPDPCPIPAPTFLAVHTGISKVIDWPDSLGAHIVDVMFRSLFIMKNSGIINFSNITTLYLSSMMRTKCAIDLHREIIAECAKTLQTLRLYLCSTDYERDFQQEMDQFVEVNECDLINLSGLTSLKSLYLVVTGRYPISLLLRLTETIKLPETHLEELKLILDDNLDGTDWTLYAINDIPIDDPRSWKNLDKLINRLLKAYDDTGVDFMMSPSDEEFDSDELAEFALKMFPLAMKSNRFNFFESQFRRFGVNGLFSSSIFAEDTVEVLTEAVVPLEGEQEKD